MSDAKFDGSLVCEIAPALRMLYMMHAKSSTGIAVFCADDAVVGGAKPLSVKPCDDLAEKFAGFVKENGYAPNIAIMKGLGFFAIGKTKKEAELIKSSFLKGGTAGLPDNHGQPATVKKRLDGKIAIVTGGAQGFGKGIADAMANEGAYIVVADLNAEGALACAKELCEKYGGDIAVPVAANVADEASVKAMVEEAVLHFGGLDILVSNAGIVISGGLSEMTKEKFELVTSVNYTGYFLCAKYASVPMKIQHEINPGYMSDIIEINSKSGLEGSNKNFAYSGSKFGGVGLTQSFALELVAFGIKVNAICPGNLLDGPLWSDPEKGLFRQYFDSGKVPGAKSIEDVRRFYESKVPMNRGCTTGDVACAILYLVEQKYETGQALPVTGGQIMLK